MAALSRTYMSALIAVVVGAVPLAYTMYPSLSASAGFWRSQRLFIALTWGVAVALLVHLASYRQERLQDQRAETVVSVREAVTDVRDAVRRAEAAVSGIALVLDQARVTLAAASAKVSSISYTTHMAEISRTIERHLLDSLSDVAREVGAPPIPASTRYLVHVAVGEGADAAGLWPVYPPERILDPALDSPEELARRRSEEITQRVLRVKKCWLDSKTSVVTLRTAEREKLNGALARAQGCAAVPLMDQEQVQVGVLTVWSGDTSSRGWSGEGESRLRTFLNLADDVAPAAAEAVAVLKQRLGSL